MNANQTIMIVEFTLIADENFDVETKIKQKQDANTNEPKSVESCGV